MAGAAAGHPHGPEAAAGSGGGAVVQAQGHAIVERAQPNAGLVAGQPVQSAGDHDARAAEDHTRHLVVQY